MSRWLNMREMQPKSAGSFTELNALMIAFMILSRLKRSVLPSLFVMVKFLISIAFKIY